MVAMQKNGKMGRTETLDIIGISLFSPSAFFSFPFLFHDANHFAHFPLWQYGWFRVPDVPCTVATWTKLPRRFQREEFGQTRCFFFEKRRWSQLQVFFCGTFSCFSIGETVL
jgi:hypothetical protein